jgi:hypothetical protein
MGIVMSQNAAYAKNQRAAFPPTPEFQPEIDQTRKVVPVQASLLYRLGAGCIVLACTGILALAFYIEPDPSGLGSHQQLHLPACGFYQRTGYPCPTCGMTTAFAHTIRGRLYQAWLIQPAGTLAALGCLLLALLSGYAALMGRKLDKMTENLNWYIILISAAAVILASWLWKCYAVWLETH